MLVCLLSLFALLFPSNVAVFIGQYSNHFVETPPYPNHFVDIFYLTTLFLQDLRVLILSIIYLFEVKHLLGFFRGLGRPIVEKLPGNFDSKPQSPLISH